MRDESYRIIGACIEVHKQLGNGFLERVYQEALAVEFRLREIPFRREVAFDIYYKSHNLEARYISDFICFDRIIVEIKAVDFLHPKHESQVLNYLAASGLPLGLLVNFGDVSLVSKRFVKLLFFCPRIT